MVVRKRTQYEIEKRDMPRSQKSQAILEYDPISAAYYIDGYWTEELTQGCYSRQDLDTFQQHLNSCPLTPLVPNRCRLILCALILLAATLLPSIILASLGINELFYIGIGVILAIVTFLFLFQLQKIIHNKYAPIRDKAMKKLFNYHQNVTFEGKGVRIIQSKGKAYIMLDHIFVTNPSAYRKQPETNLAPPPPSFPTATNQVHPVDTHALPPGFLDANSPGQAVY